MSPPLFFLHIHKTAGTTLSRLLEGFFHPDETCPARFEFELDGFGDPRRFRLFRGHINPETVERSVGPLRLVTFLRDPEERLISAYHHWQGAAWTNRGATSGRSSFMLKMREMSLLDFLTSDDPEIRAAVRDVQARLLAGGTFGATRGTRMLVSGPDLDDDLVLKAALQSLDRFELVGITEDFDRSVDRLCCRCRWRRPAQISSYKVTPLQRKDQPINAEVRTALRAATGIDRALYDEARKRASIGAPLGRGTVEGR